MIFFASIIFFYPSLIVAGNYALIIQGHNPELAVWDRDFQERGHHWWDIALLYKALINAEVPEENIVVLWGAGDDWGMDDYRSPDRYRFPMVDYSATKRNFRFVCDSLSRIITDKDILMVFFYGHGQKNVFYLCHEANPVDSLTGDELAVILGWIPYQYRMIGFQSCYSGFFTKNPILADNRTVILSATDANHLAWSADDIVIPGQNFKNPGFENEIIGGLVFYHGEWWGHFLTCLMGGVLPSLISGECGIMMVRIDQNQDERVSLQETHEYILARDSRIPIIKDYIIGKDTIYWEFPQIQDLGGISDRFYIWPKIEVEEKVDEFK